MITLRLTNDSDNWIGSDDTSAEKQETNMRLRKMFSKHGSSFMLPPFHDNTSPKFKFTVAELKSFSDIVSTEFIPPDNTLYAYSFLMGCDLKQ